MFFTSLRFKFTLGVPRVGMVALADLVIFTMVSTPHSAASAPMASATAHGIVASGDFQSFAGNQCFSDNTAGCG
jgi:hypothetical protein